MAERWESGITWYESVSVSGYGAVPEWGRYPLVGDPSDGGSLRVGAMASVAYTPVGKKTKNQERLNYMKKYKNLNKLYLIISELYFTQYNFYI